MKIRFYYNDKPPFLISLIYAFQHLLAAFNGIIAVPLIVGGSLGLSKFDISYYVSCAIFSAGIATFFQSIGIGKIGARMPCVMGTDFTFVGPSISVGKKFGIAAVFTTTFITGFTEVIYSKFIPFLKKIFPTLVSSIVVSLIGLTLIPVSIDWMAGGVGAPDYGSLQNLFLSLFVIFTIIIINLIRNEFLASISVFLGIVLGYIIAIFMRKVDFSIVFTQPYIHIPIPFYFGFKFNFIMILPFIIAYIVTTIETIGDLTAIGEVSGKPVTNKELEQGILADGVGSILGGILNAGANTSFSQNIGIIPITGVASRYVVAITGVILMIMGLFPKLGAIVAIMPPSVLGGAALIMFGMVASTGIMNLKREITNLRNLLIIALSFGFGLGVVIRPEILKNLPEFLKILFSSGITTGTITAILLNLILPKRI